jgi:hypothetical protein
MVMLEMKLCCVVLLVATSYATNSASVRLKLEERTTLHVGQTAVLQMPSNREVSESAGNALLFLKKLRQGGTASYLYRAVHFGNETLLVIPKRIPEGQCVDCVTQHYFVTVVP